MLTCLTSVIPVVMSNLYPVFSSLIMELEKLGYLPKPKGLVIEKEIGRGAYCTVHRGTLDGKPVAVKKIHKVWVFLCACTDLTYITNWYCVYMFGMWSATIISHHLL